MRKVFSLLNSQIGNKGAAALKTAFLQTNTTLLRLSFRGSKIGNEGAAALASVLQVIQVCSHLISVRTELAMKGRMPWEMQGGTIVLCRRSNFLEDNWD